MLKNKYQDWVELHNFGLADFDDMRDLYGEGMGASLFADKQDIDDSQRAKCRFVRASSFIKEHVKQDDLAVMKLNCEGGEVLILRDLIQGGIHLLSNLMVDFDICKIPSQRSEEARIKAELSTAGFTNYVTPRQMMVGRTHQARIGFWLSNLPNADEFMELTPMQKVMRRLPMSIRRLIQRNRRKPRK